MIVVNFDPARLTAAIATVADMTEDEFYIVCEAVGREIHDRTPEPNNIRSITQ